MTLRQRGIIARQLERRRTSLLKRYREQRARVGSPRGERADPVDQALGEIERGTDLLLMDMELRELEQVERAFLQLEERHFGLCRRCGGAIDWRRLAARPESVLCGACARETEGQRTIH